MSGKVNCIGIIPARMGSSRFPGKPLASINGMPMLGHVYHRSKMSRVLSEVYVATCDDEIRAYAETIGAACVMTAPTHQRATDRTAEAVAIIEHRIKRPVDIVVMIQGDEPMLWPQMIDEAVAPLLEDPSIQVVNLTGLLNSLEEQQDINEIKVVVDQAGFALYFSRSVIPSRTRPEALAVPVYKQVCIIPFQRDFLRRFAALAPTPLEQVESIDMLRAMEHGYRVKTVLTEYETHSVDTPQQLELVAEKMVSDKLAGRYMALPQAERAGS